MNPEDLDRAAYQCGRRFLLEYPGITDAIVEQHLVPVIVLESATINDAYRRLVFSAQNAQMMPRVIGQAIGGIDRLAPLLFDFNPMRVAARGWSAEELMQHIRDELQPTGKVLVGRKSLWPRFCRAVVSGATFLAQFESMQDFRKWVDFFDKDDRARAALPMIMDHEVDGIGFALACDFLKEIGYVNFSKPDVHLKVIFSDLGLTRTTHDYDVFKAVARMAESVQVSPYAVDKLFWLIGSGRFYLIDIKFPGRREEFIARCKSELGLP